MGEIYVTTARACVAAVFPAWGVFTNKELQGGGPLIDIGIHMLDAAMYVGFPAVKSVTAHAFKRSERKRAAVNLASGTRQLQRRRFAVWHREFHNGGILWRDLICTQHPRTVDYERQLLCGDKAGATLFPAHIYTDNNGELMALMQREMADDNRHLRSMEAFINRTR